MLSSESVKSTSRRDLPKGWTGSYGRGVVWWGAKHGERRPGSWSCSFVAYTISIISNSAPMHKWGERKEDLLERGGGQLGVVGVAHVCNVNASHVNAAYEIVSKFLPPHTDRTCHKFRYTCHSWSPSLSLSFSLLLSLMLHHWFTGWPKSCLNYWRCMQRTMCGFGL